MLTFYLTADKAGYAAFGDDEEGAGNTTATVVAAAGGDRSAEIEGRCLYSLIVFLISCVCLLHGCDSLNSS